jgi:hypothetical protein
MSFVTASSDACAHIANSLSSKPTLMTGLAAFFPEVRAMTEQTKKPGDPQITPHDPEHPGSRRDPEERPIPEDSEEHLREKALDKTLADSFPTSDPPSSIPDPSEDDSEAA